MNHSDFYDVSGVKAGVEDFFSLFSFVFIVVRIRLCRRATGAGGGAGQRPAHRWGAFFLRCVQEQKEGIDAFAAQSDKLRGFGGSAPKLSVSQAPDRSS
jgi:hypothetical protein